MNFRTADILHDLLGRRFACPGFLSHLHSLPVTMSQKSSLVQDDQSVSKALTLDSRRNQEGEARLLALQRTQREMPGALRAGASAGGAFCPDARGPSIRRPDHVLGGPTRSARATWTRSGTSHSIKRLQSAYDRLQSPIAACAPSRSTRPRTTTTWQTVRGFSNWRETPTSSSGGRRRAKSIGSSIACFRTAPGRRESRRPATVNPLMC